MANLEDKEKLQDCHEQTTEDIMERRMEPQINGVDSEDDEDPLPPPASTSERLKYIELIQYSQGLLYRGSSYQMASLKSVMIC